MNADEKLAIENSIANESIPYNLFTISRRKQSKGRKVARFLIQKSVKLFTLESDCVFRSVTSVSDIVKKFYPDFTLWIDRGEWIQVEPDDLFNYPNDMIHIFPSRLLTKPLDTIVDVEKIDEANMPNANTDEQEKVHKKLVSLDRNQVMHHEPRTSSKVKTSVKSVSIPSRSSSIVPDHSEPSVNSEPTKVADAPTRPRTPEIKLDHSLPELPIVATKSRAIVAVKEEDVVPKVQGPDRELLMVSSGILNELLKSGNSSTTTLVEPELPQSAKLLHEESSPDILSEAGKSLLDESPSQCQKSCIDARFFDSLLDSLDSDLAIVDSRPLTSVLAESEERLADLEARLNTLIGAM